MQQAVDAPPATYEAIIKVDPPHHNLLGSAESRGYPLVTYNQLTSAVFNAFPTFVSP